MKGTGPIEVPITEGYRRRVWRSGPYHEVYLELQEMQKRFNREHKRQPGEGSWFVFMHPEPKHAAEIQAFRERYPTELAEMASERGSNGKALTTRSELARAVLGLIKKPQFTPTVDRTYAMTKERLVDMGWTPVKDVTKAGNAYRSFWHNGRQGRVNVYAKPDGWYVMFRFPDADPYYWPQCFPNAAAAYTAVHKNVTLEPPALAAPIERIG